MRETRFQPWMCGRCGYTMDAATGAGHGAVPKEGDLALCMNCGQPLMLKAGAWRSLEADDWRGLRPEERHRLRQAMLVHAEVKGEGLIGDLTKREGAGRV